MKVTKSIFGCGMALALSAGVANAQDVPEEKKQLPVWMENIYLGGSVGATTTITDVKQYDFYPVTSNKNEVGFGFGGHLGYTINSAYAIEARFNSLQLLGSNRENNEYFKAGAFEPTLNVKANFSDMFLSGAKKSSKFTVSGSAGTGIVYFRSRRFTLNSDQLISRYGFENDGETKLTPTREIIITAGVQLNYELNNKVSLFFNNVAVGLHSDKLDAKVYGTSPYEFYTFSSLGLNYKLSEKKWIKPEVEFHDKLAKVDSILDGFKDSDGDGVMDTYDKDNKTPEGAKTTGDGMAMDTDGDGVADYVDQERLSPCTEVDENGVALDSDKDGVADCKDTEPNTAEGAQVDVNGKAIASMPGLPATTSDNSGATGADVGLPSIFFDMGSSKLGYNSYPSLTEVAKFLKKNSEAKLTVVGHTDAVGTADFNKKLGEKRAKAAVDHLVKIYGIDAGRLTAVSEGSSNGIAVGKAAQANRRVDFLYTK